MKIYNKLDENIIKEIITVLDNDGLIIFPTDTVYGLACNSFSEKAIRKLYLTKNRSFTNPINVLTDKVSKISLVADHINNIEKSLINKYFPGNLTIILNKKDGISDLLTANKKTIGVRIPNNEIALKILAAYDKPLATTSANLSGKKNGTELNDFLRDFKDKVDIIIASGKTKDIPSTIVQVTNNKIDILRQGSLKINSNLFDKISKS